MSGEVAFSVNSLAAFVFCLQLQNVSYGPSSVPGSLLCLTALWHRSHRHPKDHCGPEPQDLYLFGGLGGVNELCLKGW